MKPPEPFTSRPATLEDAAGVAELMNVYDRMYREDPDTVDAREVADWWSRGELERDTALVHDPDGRLAASGRLDEKEAGVLGVDAFVHPDFLGRGLGTFMLDWLEQEGRSRALELVRTVALATDPAAQPLIESRGFAPVRRFYQMLIELDTPPPEPVWPGGFAVSTFKPGEEGILHAVTEEAFSDHWGHEPRDLDHWQRTVFSRDWWDPSLVFLVREGAEVVAAEVNAFRFGVGWVDTLGTRKAWRGRGLGRALLLSAFGEFHRRGQRRIDLTVDAANKTGATHLYESVGMRAASQYDVYEKRL